MKSKIGDLIIQVISVMIGVFLGFAITNWSENQKETSKYNALLLNITSEIKANQVKIDQVIGYHKMLKDSTKYYLNTKEFTNFKPSFFKGVNTLSFNNSAYQTGIQTGLLNVMELEKVQAINDVYTKQRAYEEFANVLLSGLITMDFDQSEKSAQKIATFLSISMTDIVIKEEQLLQSIGHTLSIIE